MFKSTKDGSINTVRKAHGKVTSSDIKYGIGQRRVSERKMATSIA